VVSVVLAEVHKYRSMIGCGDAFFLLPEVAIDLNRLGTLQNGVGAEYKIDAQALISVKRAAAIVSPRKPFLVGKVRPI
jgi:hypothetical protein